MSKKIAWAIKSSRDNFVNRPPEYFWEADRTMLFRTRKQAQLWLDGQQFWKGRASVVKVVITIKEYLT